MDEQVPWVIAEAETAVLAKYNDIMAAQNEFESNKRDVLFHGALGGMCGAAALAMQEAELSGRYGLGISEYLDETYGAGGAIFLGLATRALFKTVKARWGTTH